MNWRLMRYWSSLRGDEPYARISEFNVEAVPGFGPHAFMLDLNDRPEDPLVRFVGQSLGQECGRNMTGKRLSEVPDGSLLARVAKHYRDVQVAKAPFEFSDEYINDSKELVLYRGIMLPFTRGGRSIDYIVGAITNKKEATDAMDTMAPTGEDAAPEDGSDGLDAQALISLVKSDIETEAEPETDSTPPVAEDQAPPLDLESLESSLEQCKALARKIEAADARSRKALYETLDKVYGFAFEAEADPGGFETLLGAAGLTRQERAPFTPIVKLVFGVDHDKTRLSEYEAALGFARRQGVEAGGFGSFIEGQPGGLKGCVAAERAARRAERGQPVDRVAKAKERLRALEPIASIEETEPGAEEFVLMLGRRGDAPGTVEVLLLLEEKQTVLEGVIKRAAKGRRKAKTKTQAKKSLFEEIDLQISGDRPTEESHSEAEPAEQAPEVPAVEMAMDTPDGGAGEQGAEAFETESQEQPLEQLGPGTEIDSSMEPDLALESIEVEELDLEPEDDLDRDAENRTSSLEERVADRPETESKTRGRAAGFSTELDEIEVEVADVDQTP